MDKILMLIFVVIFIILLLVILNKLFYKIKHKEEYTIFTNNIKKYEKQPVYHSSIDFSRVTIKNRDYLYNFICEMNPNLPHMQRLEKDTVDVVSFELNKTYFKKNWE